MNEDLKYQKIMNGIFLDFFKDAAHHFQGRVDEGKITIKELMEFISTWTERHFKNE